MSRVGRSQPVQPFVSHGFLGNTPANGVLPQRPTVVDRIDQRARYAPLPPLVRFGPVTTSVTFNDSGTCTLTLSGSGTGSQTHSGSGTCTLTLGGSGTGSQVHSGSGTCTLTFAGSGTETFSHSGSGTATVTFGGTGVEQFVPAPSGSATGFLDQILEILHVTRRI